MANRTQGNEYKTKLIGEQLWITENLRLEVGKNSYCYNDTEIECEVMGRLYTCKPTKGAKTKHQGKKTR